MAGLALQVFVSSMCYELRDLRAAVKSWLEAFGCVPLMSDDSGFPHGGGIPPYAECLRAIEQAPMFIAVIDRQYGRPFDDWAPFTEYKGCSPVHGEIRHALKLQKRVLIYVRDDTWNFYEVWRKNKEALTHGAPNGLDIKTLEMFHELKHLNPAPWMSHFKDTTDLLQSLNMQFVNQLYAHLRDGEEQAADLAGYLLQLVAKAEPGVRERVIAALNPDLIKQRDELLRTLAEVEGRAGATPINLSQLEKLGAEKTVVESKIDTVDFALATEVVGAILSIAVGSPIVLPLTFLLARKMSGVLSSLNKSNS